MANIFIAPIYGINNNQVGTSNGSSYGFPGQGVLVRPVGEATTFHGATMRAIIQLLPGGTVVNQPQYYTVKTVAEVQTLANA